MPRKYQIERWRGEDGQYYWHLRAPNGQIQCQGEGHPVKHSVPRATKRIAKVLPTAEIVDVAEGYTPPPRKTRPKLPKQA